AMRPRSTPDGVSGAVTGCSDQPRTATVWHRLDARRKGTAHQPVDNPADPGAGGWVCHLMSLRGASGDTPPGHRRRSGGGVSGLWLVSGSAPGSTRTLRTSMTV